MTFTLEDVKAAYPIWIFDGTTYSTTNGLKKIYAVAGDYTVDVKIGNANGISDGVITKTFHVDNTIMDFTKYYTLLCKDGKKWHIDGETAGHMGCGEPGTNGGPYGDLYIEFKVKKHDVFERSGNNTSCSVPITFAQAALGGEIEVPTIYGKEKYTLKEGTQPGDSITLRSKGIPSKSNPNIKGDHVVKFILEVPTGLSREQKQLLTQFNNTLTERNYARSSQFFQKIKNLFK